MDGRLKLSINIKPSIEATRTDLFRMAGEIQSLVCRYGANVACALVFDEDDEDYYEGTYPPEVDGVENEDES